MHTLAHHAHSHTPAKQTAGAKKKRKNKNKNKNKEKSEGMDAAAAEQAAAAPKQQQPQQQAPAAKKKSAPEETADPFPVPAGQLAAPSIITTSVKGPLPWDDPSFDASEEARAFASNWTEDSAQALPKSKSAHSGEKKRADKPKAQAQSKDAEVG